MPTPTGSPETPEPAQRAGSARSGRRRDRTQHDRRHGEDVVSDEPDSQGETLDRARGDSRGQRPADHLTHRPRNASRPPLRRRRRVALAGAALSLLAGLLGLLALLSPVAAQSVTTLVSNVDQGSDNSWNVSDDRSQPFTTGAAGATLSSVEIISEDNQGDDVAVSLCTVDGSNHPTATCTALTPPSSFAAGTLVFTDASSMTLDADTTYSVLITSPGGDLLKLDTTSSDNEDAGVATGWSIADTSDSEMSPNVWSSITTSLRITIKGTLDPATNNAAMGEPTISGTARVGRTLTASTTGITDADGLTSPTYTYQWIRANGTDADIASANSSTYTLVGADLGKTIKVKVSFTDDASNTETLTSAAYPSSGTVQANNVLVSNVGQTQASIFSLATFDLAQSFRTGANATGYTLTSIELRLDSTNSTNP